MLIGGPPLPPRDPPPRREREGGGEGGRPPSPREGGGGGGGKGGGGGRVGTWVRRDRVRVCSSPWRGNGVGRGKEAGEGAGRPDLWQGQGVQDTDRQTDRKIQRSGRREGKLDGADRKEWGNRRDKWLVTWLSNQVAPLLPPTGPLAITPTPSYHPPFCHPPFNRHPR